MYMYIANFAQFLDLNYLFSPFELVLHSRKAFEQEYKLKKLTL